MLLQEESVMDVMLNANTQYLPHATYGLCNYLPIKLMCSPLRNPQRSYKLNFFKDGL